MPESAESNGTHATRAEHEGLRHFCERRFNELAESNRFIEQQMRLFGQAMELLLAERGLEMPGDDDA